MSEPKITAPAPPANPSWVRQAARAFGPLPNGTYRVVLDPPESKLYHHDAPTLDEARRYADDTASEADYPPTLAYILDDTFNVIDRGMHYGMRQRLEGK